jgi:hypothetical protein
MTKLDALRILKLLSALEVADEHIEGCEGINLGVGKAIRAGGQA